VIARYNMTSIENLTAKEYSELLREINKGAEKEREVYSEKLDKYLENIEEEREKYSNLLERWSRGEITKHAPKKKKYNFFQKAVLMATAITNLGTLMGCPNLHIPEKPEPTYSAPTAKLTSDKTSVKLGESVPLNLEGKDDDEDMTEYKIGDDKNSNGIIDLGEEITVSSSAITNYSWTPTYTGTAKLIGEIKDKRGLTGKDDLEMIVSEKDIPVDPTDPIDYLDVKLNLQDDEAHIGKKGIAQIYDASNFDFENYTGTLLEEKSTQLDGIVEFHLNKKVSELPKGIVVRVKGTDENGNQDSFVRTKKFPEGDVILSELEPIRVVPYDNPNNSYDDELLDTEEKRINFIEHMGRINFWSAEERKKNMKLEVYEYVNGNSEHGNKKWNLGELEDTLAHPIFKGIKISKSIPNYEKLKLIIQEEDSNISIVEEDNPISEQGWITAFPSPKGNGPYAKLFDTVGSDGYLEKAEVYLNTTDSKVVIHEIIFHAKRACAGHSNSSKVSALFNSIGEYTSTSESPNKSTSADIKSNYLIDEPTYLGMEKLDDILRIN
jgi:hypothetical protein